MTSKNNYCKETITLYSDVKPDVEHRCFVATTIEITTTIEIIISIVVENKFQTKHHIATTNEITTTIEIIISIVVENKFQSYFTSQPLMK